MQSGAPRQRMAPVMRQILAHLPNGFPVVDADPTEVAAAHARLAKLTAEVGGDPDSTAAKLGTGS